VCRFSHERYSSSALRASEMRTNCSLLPPASGCTFWASRRKAALIWVGSSFPSIGRFSVSRCCRSSKGWRLSGYARLLLEKRANFSLIRCCAARRIFSDSRRSSTWSSCHLWRDMTIQAAKKIRPYVSSSSRLKGPTISNGSSSHAFLPPVPTSIRPIVTVVTRPWAPFQMTHSYSSADARVSCMPCLPGFAVTMATGSRVDAGAPQFRCRHGTYNYCGID
jgi:hypothetical protein